MQAASSFSVKSMSREFSSNFALRKSTKIRINEKIYKHLWKFTNNIRIRYIPVCKSPWPGKDRGYAISARFTSFLVNAIMAGNCAMCCLCLDRFPIWADLLKYYAVDNGEQNWRKKKNEGRNSFFFFFLWKTDDIGIIYQYWCHQT